MKTTIEIRDALLREAREVARREGTTLRALVEEGLARILKERRERKPGKYRLKLITHDGGGLLVDLSPGNWRRIREMSNDRDAK
jgi:hypothetical protein